MSRPKRDPVKSLSTNTCLDRQRAMTDQKNTSTLKAGLVKESVVSKDRIAERTRRKRKLDQQQHSEEAVSTSPCFIGGQTLTHLHQCTSTESVNVILMVPDTDMISDTELETSSIKEQGYLDAGLFANASSPSVNGLPLPLHYGLDLLNTQTTFKLSPEIKEFYRIYKQGKSPKVNKTQTVKQKKLKTQHTRVNRHVTISIDNIMTDNITIMYWLGIFSVKRR
jgi:hypothetical protein